MKMITSFGGDYRFLSNFWECEVPYDGYVYASSEHAYQAAKTLDPDQAQLIREARTPGVSKRLGAKADRRPDWDDIKIQIMGDILEAKFRHNPYLLERLDATKGCELVEGNTWGDNFWGRVSRGHWQKSSGQAPDEHTR